MRRAIKRGNIYQLKFFNSRALILALENFHNQEIVHIKLINIEYEDGHIYNFEHLPVTTSSLEEAILIVEEQNAAVETEDNEGYQYWLNCQEDEKGVWDIPLIKVIAKTIALVNN